jgi:hypothetical protein
MSAQANGIKKEAPDDQGLFAMGVCTSNDLTVTIQSPKSSAMSLCRT